MTQPFDITAIRNESPVTKRMLYLDSAHQTPLASSAPRISAPPPEIDEATREQLRVLEEFMDACRREECDKS